jgi:hypothetical protein
VVGPDNQELIDLLDLAMVLNGSEEYVVYLECSATPVATALLVLVKIFRSLFVGNGDMQRQMFASSIDSRTTSCCLFRKTSALVNREQTRAAAESQLIASPLEVFCWNNRYRREGGHSNLSAR